MSEKKTENQDKSNSQPSLRIEQRTQTAEGYRRSAVKQSANKRKKPR